MSQGRSNVSQHTDKMRLWAQDNAIIDTLNPVDDILAGIADPHHRSLIAAKLADIAYWSRSTDIVCLAAKAIAAAADPTEALKLAHTLVRMAFQGKYHMLRKRVQRHAESHN